jgi:DNA-binding transcriptional LysR family regulator
MIKRFVMAGLGLSFLAASHCQEEAEAGKLATVSLAPEPMIRQVALIYRKDKALSKAALGFIDAALRHAMRNGAAEPVGAGARAGRR